MAPSRRANSLSSLRLQDFNSQPTAFFHNSSTRCQQRSVSHAPDKPIDSRDLPNASCSKSHLYSRRMSNLIAYVDGGSRGNPGPSGIGVVIDGYPSGPIRIAKWIGYQDNNVAEYAALLEALQCAVNLKATTLHVYSDSEVVVRQMRGEYSCRSTRLYSLHWVCRKLARSLEFSISHIPREHNAEANGLAHSATRGILN